MYSSDTDAHSHVNSHILRRITCVTCQTSHMYNTLSVLFSNLPASSRVSPNLKQSLRPTFGYSWGGGVKGMFLPLVSRAVDPVCFHISPLYQIISLQQFHQLSYYTIFKRELCKHHVRDPESTISWAPHGANRLTNFSATNYIYCTIRKCGKKTNI